MPDDIELEKEIEKKLRAGKSDAETLKEILLEQNRKIDTRRKTPSTRTLKKLVEEKMSNDSELRNAFGENFTSENQAYIK
jgi:hypothetical protein